MGFRFINDFIDKFTSTFAKNTIIGLRKALFILFGLSSAFLLSLKLYIAFIVLSLHLLVELIYIFIILRKKEITIYAGIGIGLILSRNLCVLIITAIYSVPNLIGAFDPILFIIILLIEFLCLVGGFLYSLHNLKKGILIESKAAAFTALATICPGMLGYHLVRLIAHSAPAHIQSILLSMIFAAVGGYIMFIIGMVYIPMVYFIKKYNIPDRIITSKKQGDNTNQ